MRSSSGKGQRLVMSTIDRQRKRRTVTTTTTIFRRIHPFNNSNVYPPEHPFIGRFDDGSCLMSRASCLMPHGHDKKHPSLLPFVPYYTNPYRRRTESATIISNNDNDTYMDIDMDMDHSKAVTTRTRLSTVLLLLLRSVIVDLFKKCVCYGMNHRHCYCYFHHQQQQQ